MFIEFSKPKNCFTRLQKDITILTVLNFHQISQHTSVYWYIIYF